MTNTITVFNPKAGWKPRSLLAKVDAGARFIQTQLCFDVPALKRYQHHVRPSRYHWYSSQYVVQRFVFQSRW
ncbi:MAG: hypothetical protein GQ538_11980 [Xanthomonadales bacterium]|nr:hypothetical protein [Xanthomonadales bacterium]